MGAKLLDLMGGGLAGVVTGDPFLAGLEEVLRPAVVEVLGDAFLAAQLGDAVLAAHAFEHDADLLLGRELAPRRSADIPDELLGAVRLPSIPVSHHRSPSGSTMSPELSLTQSPQSVRQVLTVDKRQCRSKRRRLSPEGEIAGRCRGSCNKRVA